MSDSKLPTKPDADEQLQRRLDGFAMGVFGLLVLGALLGNYALGQRIALIMGTVLSVVVYAAANRFRDGGPYDTRTISALQLWPVAIAFGVISALTGGAGSPLIVSLLMPVVSMSLKFGSREALKVGVVGLVTWVVFTLLVPGARQTLATELSTMLLLGLLILFTAYWLGLLGERLMEAQRVQHRMVNLEQEKSEFVGLASHHLRTPLSSIKGYVNYLLDDNGNPLRGEQRTIAERLDAGIKRVEAIVDNMMMVATMERGQVRIHRTLGDFSALVRGVLAQYESSIHAKQLKLVAEIPDLSGEEITFDPNRMREAINNLMDNALKFTSQGFIKVTVGLKGNQVLVSVADSGIGISRQEQVKLFEKFARSGSVLEAWDHEGAGLGLYITRLIVEAHGGRIGMESEPGEGSRFVFSIPRLGN